ncbi:hypothetical protein RHSIM_Rhsim04G0042900 [Rhododendron simsii]|uniref:Uncharacterized protein n=1 Tax=Rhododendron simsii TaxID=118357 RepID=A0A834H0I5_RHOSS|nr:hypothetical protein RHSIM_Rhsim04G0042900 [Rhododendron simsii]
MDGMASLRFQRETLQVPFPPFLPLYKKGGSEAESLSCSRSRSSEHLLLPPATRHCSASLRRSTPGFSGISAAFTGSSTGILAANGPTSILPSWETSPPSHSEGDLDGSPSAGVSMVDSSINSPDVDPKAYPSLLETIQGLGKGYRSFDESSSNFPRFPGLPVIPGIHILLQSDDSAVRGSQFVQGTSSRQTVGTDIDAENLAKRMAAGAQAGTSTSSAEPLNTSVARGSNAPPRPPRDVDTIPPLPSGLGPTSYNHFYCDGPRGFTEQFRTQYLIPDDVLVERVSTDRIPFGQDFIVLPLFAITEGGEHMAYTLLGDKIGRVEQLVAHIRGLDADVYGVKEPKVSGNFEWGPINPLLDYPFPTRTGSAIERPYRIPRVRGFPGSGDKPDCSAPNKGLFVTSKWPNLIALLQCANRDALTLLDYEPTYAGFAHRKDKSKMVRKTVDLATVAGQALQQLYQAQDLSTAELPERKEQPDQVPISHLEQQEPPARTETYSRR